ncbi:MAG: fused MFS/spermidine synthase [Schwartzia sp.]|nr:fused MFS/spermidine synthase [Schwartzia sp. (in: firmicutes)]
MENGLLKSKTYLYATAFFSGMSVMAVEIGASRLLAPYFSASQIVWTIIIGVIMIALALGNVWGGRLADRSPDPANLYRRLIFAALWIAAIPVLGKYVIALISGLLIVAIDTNLLVTAAFLSCLAIFVFPLLLLGTVTPSLVKYATDSLDENGRVVGNLGAFNTAGSIIGTFLPTFVTIPAAGTAATFLIFAGVLLVLGLGYFFGTGAEKRLRTLSLLVYLACALLGANSSPAFWEPALAYEGESVYNYLQVKDDEKTTIFSTSVMFSVQSKRVKDGSLTGMYFDYALAAPTLTNGGNILILGMGTGTFAEQCRRYFPSSNSLGVEIDEKIISLSRKYFELPEEIPVVAYDGRAYLQMDENRYDVIMVDAFRDITIPFQMSSVEFFRLVEQHLAPGGVVAVNLNMRASGAGNINERLIDTIGAVFPAVRTVTVANGTNLELFAARDETTLDKLPRLAEKLQDRELSTLMRHVAANWQSPARGGEPLTDDKAPVELLGMRAIDAIIREELQYYKEIYRREGFDGLQKALM